jgi:methylthioxylose transferase
VDGPSRENRGPILALAVGAVLVAAAWWVIDRTQWPLGVTGEWTWGRFAPHQRAAWLAYGLAGVWAAGLAAWVAWGLGWVERARRPVWCGALVVTTLLAGLFQTEVEHISTPGLFKWMAALYFESAGGPYSAVRDEVTSVDALLRDYPGFLARFPARQGHVTNQPPGLFTVYRVLLTIFRQQPRLTAHVIAWTPAGMKAAFNDEARLRGAPIPRPDQALLVAVAWASRGLAVLVMWPVAALVRLRGTRTSAWLAAAAAGLTPAAIAFAPRADTVFPTWTALILLLTGVALYRGSIAAAVVAGLALAIGAFATLVFAAIAMWIVVWVALHASQTEPGRRWAVVGKTVGGGLAGFAVVPVVCFGVWRLNLPEIWAQNLRYHAEFYQFFPRSYLPWVAVNLMEAAVALGLPAAMLLIFRFGVEIRRAIARRPFDPLLLSWWAILLALDLSGRNLSEVARLWLFLYPLGAGLGAEVLADLASLAQRRLAAAALICLQAAACIVLSRSVNVLFLT